MITVVIPWFNRHELKQALPSIVESVTQASGKICIINFMGDVDLVLSQIEGYEQNVNCIHFTGNEAFNKSIAQNLGAKYTDSDYLFFCDCDIILNKFTVQNLLQKIKENDQSFVTLCGVKETDLNARKAKNLVVFGYELKLKIKDGSTVQIIDNEEDVSQGTRQAPGLLVVKREHFLKINGYNSRLSGWGWEDQDMICRLTLSAKLQRIQTETALHISHDDASRMQSYTQYFDRWQSRDAMFRKALFNYDNNDFSGTYIEDCKKFVLSNIQAIKK